MATHAIAAAQHLNSEGIGVTVIDPRWVLPVNPAIAHLAARHRRAITIEDGLRGGGMGAAITRQCTDQGVATPLRTIGLPNAFIPHGDLLARYGLTADGIVHTTMTALAEAPEQAS